MEPARILIMDLDSPPCPQDHRGRLARLLHDLLSARAIDVRVVTNEQPEMPSSPPDLMLLRPAVTEDLPEVVQSIRKKWSPASILGLFCTEKDTPAVVLQSLFKGLDDFLTCPFRDIDVLPRIEQFLQAERKPSTELLNAEIKAQLRIEGLVGESGPFRRVLHMVLRVAHADTTVLISGETGTGKELVAQAIHYHSPRRGKPFVPVNCGALPEHLIENELFGHAKGAYTDASSPEKGLVAEAEAGTLFLDEVDTLSPAIQVKLLRFLQDHKYRPLGSTKHQTADVRIIAATNADLQSRVQAQQFREDLYYRLNILSLRLPPLRERSADIPLLAAYFLRRYGRHHGREAIRLSANALHKLVAYPWPGNVRELETVIQRAVILASSPAIQPQDIALPFVSQHTVSDAASFRQAKARAIEQFERAYLTHLLATHAGNISQAAKHTGEARRSLQRLLKKHDLNRCAFQA